MIQDGMSPAPCCRMTVFNDGFPALVCFFCILSLVPFELHPPRTCPSLSVLAAAGRAGVSAAASPAAPTAWRSFALPHRGTACAARAPPRCTVHLFDAPGGPRGAQPAHRRPLFSPHVLVFFPLLALSLPVPFLLRTVMCAAKILNPTPRGTWTKGGAVLVHCVILPWLNFCAVRDDIDRDTEIEGGCAAARLPLSRDQ